MPMQEANNGTHGVSSALAEYDACATENQRRCRSRELMHGVKHEATKV